MSREGQSSFDSLTVTAWGAKFSTPCVACIRVNNPRIIENGIDWVQRGPHSIMVPTEREKADKVKYGTEAFLRIQTTSAYHCFALVVVRCEDWRDDFVGMTPIMRFPDGSEETIFSFTPQAEWLDDIHNTYTSTMTAEVYLVYEKITLNRGRRLSVPELREMAVRFESASDDDYYWDFRRGLNNRFVLCYRLGSRREIEVSKIVIVIDPGHGWSRGSTGTECRQFVYFGRNEEDERDTSSTRTDTAFNLPDYVLEEIEYWIQRFTYIPRIPRRYQEWFYVIDVSLLLKAELERSGEYRVLLTREVEPNPQYRIQIAGTDTMRERHRVPNDNDADYFISIHCDGQPSFRLSGAFVLYPRNGDTNSDGQDVRKSRTLGQDIVTHYTALNIARDPIRGGGYIDPVRQPAPNDGKFVLMRGNETQRRVLVELGRMTNPHDILGLYQPNIQQTMAENLAQGIIFNITNRFANE